MEVDFDDDAAGLAAFWVLLFAIVVGAVSLDGRGAKELVELLLNNQAGGPWD